MNKPSLAWLKQRSRYLPLFFAVWVGITVTLYLFWFPLPQPNAHNPYPAVILTLWISWIALTGGSVLLRFLKLPAQSQAEHWVFSAAIGFATLAYLIFGLGLLRLLYPSVIYSLLIALTILSVTEIKPFLNSLRYYGQRSYHITKLDMALGTILLGLFGYHALGTLIPPLLFDALVYHLAIPKLYLLQHSIGYIPYNFYSNFPFLMEMLYTLGLAVHGPLVVNMLNYVIHLLMLASLYSVARAYGNHRMGLLSVMIFYTVPWVGMESFLPYIDVGLALYTVLALYALLNWIHRQHSNWLIVCGVCSGAGVSIKYLGAHNAVVMGLSVVGWLLWLRTHPPTPSLAKRGGEEAEAATDSCSPSFPKKGSEEEEAEAATDSCSPSFPKKGSEEEEADAATDSCSPSFPKKGSEEEEADAATDSCSPSFPKKGSEEEEADAATDSCSPSLHKRGGRGVSSRLRALLFFAIPAILCGAPWYLKSLIFTGNPIYPFVFGGGEWSAEMLHHYMQEYQIGFSTFAQGLLTFLKLPWELVFALNLTPSNVPIGPVFLVFLPALLFVRRVTPVIVYYVGASVVLTIFWLNTSPQSRFLIPTLPLLSMATAYAIEQISTETRTAWLKRAAYGLLIVLLISNIGWELIYVHTFFDPFEVIMGLESADDYLSRQRPDIYPITRYANETLPPDAKILFLGESRGYYADRPFIANTGHDRTAVVDLTSGARSLDELADRFRDRGVTHIIFNRREGARLHNDYQYFRWKTPQDEQLFWEFYRTRLKPLYSVNDSELLEIAY